MSTELHVVPSAPPPPVQKPVVIRRVKELPLIERKNWLLHLHYVRKDHAKCREIAEQLLTESHNASEFALFIKGLLLREDGKIQDSFNLFQQCIEMNPKRLEHHLQAARSLFLLGRHHEAIEVYKSAVQMAPNSWEVAHNLGVCYFHLGEPMKAKEHLKNAIKLDKREISFTVLAKVYLMEKDIKMAADVYQRALSAFPESSELLATLGLIYLHLKDYPKAFELLGNSLTYDPENSKAILAAGCMMQLHNDYDVALSKYRIAAAKTPESASVWNNIAMCFYGKKKYVPAVTCLKRAHYLDPFDWRALYNLGLVHITLGQSASAFHFLRAAIPLAPNNASLYLMLAIALTNMDDPVNAHKAYLQAAELEPGNPDVLVNFAQFLYNTGDRQKSQKIHSQLDKLIRGSRSANPDIVDACNRLGVALHIGVEAAPKSKTNSKSETSSSRRLAAPVASIDQDNASIVTLKSNMDVPDGQLADDAMSPRAQPNTTKSGRGSEGQLVMKYVETGSQLDVEQQAAGAAKSRPGDRRSATPVALLDDSALKPSADDLSRSSYDADYLQRVLPTPSVVDPAIETLPEPPSDDPEGFWAEERPMAV